jgi:hypothetical protein
MQKFITVKSYKYDDQGRVLEERVETWDETIPQPVVYPYVPPLTFPAAPPIVYIQQPWVTTTTVSGSGQIDVNGKDGTI